MTGGGSGVVGGTDVAGEAGAWIGVSKEISLGASGVACLEAVGCRFRRKPPR